MPSDTGALVPAQEQQLARAETAASAIAAREEAAVKARYLMALQRPRDVDLVRQRLLKECQRPGFADVAMYAKPVGKQRVRGLSIRFAEAAIRHFTNVLTHVSVVFDDEKRRILHVSVIDLETNATYGEDVTLEKVVERRQPREGQEVIGQRVNTEGEVVYLVRATEDDFRNKQAAAVSKAIRNYGLRLIPGDILDECRATIERVKADRAAQDPDAEKKRVLDAFAGIGVSADRMKKYLGHPLEEISPAELVELREVYEAIRDGETTWAALMEERLGEASRDAGRTQPPRKSDRGGADGGSPAPSGATGAIASRPEEKHEERKPPPAARGTAASAKLTPTTFAEIFKAIPLVNRAAGESKAKEILATFDVTSPSQLTEEQGQEYLRTLRTAAGIE